MPQVKVKTASGTVFFNYTISTPFSDSAGSIDPSLPTVLLLHPVYLSHVAFHRRSRLAFFPSLIPIFFQPSFPAPFSGALTWSEWTWGPMVKLKALYRRRSDGRTLEKMCTHSWWVLFYCLIGCCDDVQTFFQKALSLPPCHLFGLSLGACVALQMAVSHPDKVLSLFMLSPLPLIEVGYVDHHIISNVLDFLW